MPLQLKVHVRDATRQAVKGRKSAPLPLFQFQFGVLRMCRHNASASSNGNGSRKGISRKQAAENEEDVEEGGKLAAFAAPAAVLTGLALLIGIGVVYKHELKDFIEHFVAVLDTWGPARCISCPAVQFITATLPCRACFVSVTSEFMHTFLIVLLHPRPSSVCCRYPAYGALYTLLEVLALPAVPLTMTAGLLFGVGPGAAVVSVSATAAATISFLIARYAGVPTSLSYGAHKQRSHTAGY